MANEFKIRKGLIVEGASGGTVVDVQGSQGQLFSVTDNLSGSIFAVSDISGVPILDINSSGTIQFSDLGAGTLVTDANGNISVSSGGGAGGPYLPLSAGSGSPLTGDLWLDDNSGASPSLYLQNGSNNYWRLLNGSTGIFALKEGTSDRITILPGGNVGIGSTSPSSKLELGPNGSLGADITNKNVILNIDGGYGSTGTPSSGQYKVIGFTGTTRDVTDITGQTSGEVLKNFYLGMIGGDYFNVNRFSFWQGGDERLTIQGYGSAAGNVGIGDTSPVAKLDVAGDVQATSFYNLANPSPIMFPEGGTYNGSSSETGYIVIKLPDTGGAGQNNMMTCLVRIFDYASNESFDVRFNGYFYGSDYLWTRNAVWIDSSANVDRNFTVRFGKELGGSGSQDRAVVTIGEASGTWSYPKVAVIQYTPGHSEGAQPQIWNSGWNVSIVEDYWDGTDNTLDDTITNNQVNNWRRNGQALYYGSGTGNVGIGTTDPGAKLELKKETTWGTLDNQAIYINNTGTGGDTSLLHDMGSITWRSSNVNTAAISGIRNTPGSGNNVDLRFTTATQSGGQQTSMTILSGGNVGIGVTDPQAKLEVMGASATPADGNEIISVTNTTGGSKLLLGVVENSYGWIQSAEGGTLRNLLLNPSGGNVGIGTTLPSEKLAVSGNIIADNIFATSKIINGDTSNANPNLLTQADIKIANQNDIYGNTTKVVISPYEATYTHNGTGTCVIRLDPENNMTPGDTYTFSVYYKDLVGTLVIDIVDTSVTGPHTSATGTAAAPKSGRIYGTVVKPTTAPYSGYNFIDINLSTSGVVTLLHPKLETGKYPTEFVATTEEEGVPETTTTNNIIATGDVGIGETNPTSGLVVRKDTAGGRGGEISIVNYATNTIGNDAALNFGLEASTYHADFGNAQIKARVMAANAASDMIFSTWNGTSFGERMRIDSSGYVGIGTSDPDEKLDITGGYLKFNGGDYGIKGSASLTYNPVSDHYFMSNGSTKVTIKSSGNVGIGTANPGQKLHVVGNVFLNANSAYMASYNNTNSYHGSLRWAGLQLGNNGTNRIVAGRTNTGGSLQFWTNNTTDAADYTVTPDGIMTMIMTETGNVGIGTTSPGTALQVGGLDDGSNYDITLGWNAVNTQAVGTKRSALTFKTSQTGVNNLDIYKWDIAMVTAPATASNEPFGSDLAFLRSTRNATSVDETTMILTQLGNVGIGTDSPNAKLDVQGTQGQLFSVTDDLSGDIFSVADISGVPIMNVNSDGTSYFDGDVGIGVNNPSYKLDVWGNGIALGSAAFAKYDSSNDLFLVGDWDGAGADMAIYDGNSSEVLRVAGGNVGINTTDPKQKLHVNDGGIRVEKFGTGLGGFISIGNGTEQVGNYSAYYFGNTANDTGYFKGGIAYETLSTTHGRGDMHFLQRSDTGAGNANISHSVMTILNGGNVGIGTTDPSAKLEVKSGDLIINNSGAKIDFRDGGGNSKYFLELANSNADLRINDRTGAGSVSMTVQSGGNVGINETNPAQKLHINSGRMLISNNTTPLYIKANTAYKSWVHHIGGNSGYIFAPSTVADGTTWDWSNQTKLGADGVVTAKNFKLSSDERLKNNIKDIKGVKVDAAFKSFEMESSPGEKRYGVVAQELEKNNPELVTTDEKGFKSVMYIDLLIAKIAELEARLEKAGI